MIDGQLFDAIAQPACFDEELSVERRAVRTRLHPLPDVAAEQLECAVDIAGGGAEHEVDEDVPGPALDSANDAVGSVRTVPDDDVVAGVQCIEQAIELAHVELAVGRGIEDHVTFGSVEPKLEAGVSGVAGALRAANDL